MLPRSAWLLLPRCSERVAQAMRVCARDAFVVEQYREDALIDAPIRCAALQFFLDVGMLGHGGLDAMAGEARAHGGREELWHFGTLEAVAYKVQLPLLHCRSPPGACLHLSAAFNWPACLPGCRVEEMDFNISAPHMHATCLEALQLQPGHKVGGLGGGTGVGARSPAGVPPEISIPGPARGGDGFLMVWCYLRTAAAGCGERVRRADRLRRLPGGAHGGRGGCGHPQGLRAPLP